MRKFKQLLAYGLVAVMSLSMVACGSKEDSDDEDDDDSKKKSSKKVTVESLLEDIPADKIESVTAGIKLDLDFGMDLKQAMLDQGTTEDELEEAIDNGEIEEDMLNMEIVMKMDVTSEISEDYMHMSGDMEMKAAGEEESDTMESYTDYSDEDTTVTYTYDPDMEEWYKTEEDKEEDDEMSFEDFNKITEYIKDSEIVDEDDDVYVLEVVLDLEKLSEEEADTMEEIMDTAGDSAEEFLGDSEDIISSIEELTVTIEIDKDTNYISSIKIDLVDMFEEIIKSLSEADAATEQYAGYISINKFAMEITFDDYNKTEVEIPEDVIEEAVEEDVFDWDDEDFDWDDDEDSWDDEDIDWDDEDEDTINKDVFMDEYYSDFSEDSVVVNGDKFELRNYSDELLTNVTVPKGFEIDMENSSDTLIFLDGANYEGITVSTFSETWVEDLMDGKAYESDSDYTRDEASEVTSVTTNLGTVRVFVRTWSFDENPTENFYQDVTYVLGDDYDHLTVVETTYEDIEATGYTIESLIQTMLQ